MLQLERNLLSVALLSALALSATTARAQDSARTDATDTADVTSSDATTLDVVQVTGIRAGIERAIDTKRDSTSIVEAVSAEDIGKLPDISIAESLARLPGLSAQRVAGRAQVISVRGLSPDFATTLLNGREVVSTGDNRSVEFDQYPSELMSGATVYKTPDAGLIGQGLSGTIDMQTVRPLNFADRVVSISGRYQENSLDSAANADADGNRFNVSYIDQFADNTIGLSLGYSHIELPTQENQVGLYEPWKDRNDDAEGTPLNRPGLPEYKFYSDGIKALRRTGESKRDAYMATLQFRPSNAWTSTLDLFHTEASQTDTANQFEVNLGNYPDGLLITDPVINGNDTFTGGVANQVYPLVRGLYNTREDKIDAFGWNNEFNVGFARIVADVSYSKATRDELNLENNTQLLPNPTLDSLALTYRNNDFSQLVPGLDYSNPDSLFLTNTIYGSGYGKAPRVEDELKSARLVLSLPAPEQLGWLSNIDVGFNYADRKKDKRQPEGNILLGAQGDTTIASDLQYKPVNLGFAGIGYIPSWNVPAAVARYMVFEPTEDLSYLVPKKWTVDEEIITGYIRADIDTEWGSVPVRGNFGVQFQNVDQRSASAYWDPTQPAGSNAIPFEDGKNYTDVLPSMNLAFLFAHDQTLRVAAAKQVARPRVDQMRASFEFGVDENNGLPGASGGNPLLDPWEANAFDISYEKYFGGKGYVAAAYFYKDLKTYIYTEKRDGYDYTDVLADYDYKGTVPLQTTGTFTAPYNGEGGSMQGLELSASIPFDLFSDALEGFGIQASASFTDSDITIPPDPDTVSSVGSDPISLPGLSDEVYNLTAYFERGGFEARVSQRKRSDFIGEIGNFNGNRTLRYVVGEDVTDAQVSYTFGSGALEGLGLIAQVSNLTNSPYQTYAGSKDRPLEYIEWGRTWLVGFSYKF